VFGLDAISSWRQRWSCCSGLDPRDPGRWLVLHRTEKEGPDTGPYFLPSVMPGLTRPSGWHREKDAMVHNSPTSAISSWKLLQKHC